MPPSNRVPAGTHRVTVVSDDGVELAGDRRARRPSRRPRRPITFVVAHGFTNSVARPSFLRMAGWLRRFGEVRALDFRGHGRSGGGVGDRRRPGDARRRRRGGGRPRRRRRRRWSPSGSPWAGERRCGRPPSAGTARTPWSASARSAAGTSATPARCGACTGCWRPPPDAGSATRLVGLRLDEPWLIPPTSPLQVVSDIAPTPVLLVHGDRDEYFPLEHFRTLAQAAGPDGHRLGGAGLRTRRERRHRSARRADRPLGVCHDQRVSPRLSEAQESAPSARAHHLPAAGLTVAAVALLVLLPELLGDRGRLAAVLVLQLGLVLAWVLATGIQGFAGSLAVGAAAAVAADLLLVAAGAADARRPARRLRPRRSSPPSCSRCSAARATTSSPRCPATVLLLCPVGALAALLLLGRSHGLGPGAGRAARRRRRPGRRPPRGPGAAPAAAGARRAARPARPGAGGAGRRRGDLPAAGTSPTCPARRAPSCRRGARRRGRADRARGELPRRRGDRREAAGTDDRRGALGAGGRPGGAPARRVRARSPSPC